MQSSHIMVIMIVLMVMIASVLKAKYRAQNGIIENEDWAGNKTQQRIESGDTERMQEEIRTLKDRIQVLERIATDNNTANDINRQIEQLRDR